MKPPKIKYATQLKMTKSDSSPFKQGKQKEKILEFDPSREGGDGIMLHNINATNFILSAKVSIITIDRLLVKEG